MKWFTPWGKPKVWWPRDALGMWMIATGAVGMMEQLPGYDAGVPFLNELDTLLHMPLYAIPGVRDARDKSKESWYIVLPAGLLVSGLVTW